MKIFGKPNVEERLLPLFKAMNRGEKIKKIICMGGTMNANNRKKDFVLRDFIVSNYFGSTPNNDMVDVQEWGKSLEGENGPHISYMANNEKTPYTSFYMVWVRDFELY